MSYRECKDKCPVLVIDQMWQQQGYNRQTCCRDITNNGKCDIHQDDIWKTTRIFEKLNVNASLNNAVVGTIMKDNQEKIDGLERRIAESKSLQQKFKTAEFWKNKYDQLNLKNIDVDAKLRYTETERDQLGGDNKVLLERLGRYQESCAKQLEELGEEQQRDNDASLDKMQKQILIINGLQTKLSDQNNQLQVYKQQLESKRDPVDNDNYEAFKKLSDDNKQLRKELKKAQQELEDVFFPEDAKEEEEEEKEPRTLKRPRPRDIKTKLEDAPRRYQSPPKRIKTAAPTIPLSPLDPDNIPTPTPTPTTNNDNNNNNESFSLGENNNQFYDLPPLES